ncbi:MAG: TatD family hydrolase [Bacteroidales bacterium]|nr:TatD family hydrolase [Bacteroidales bacterium]MBN2631987.1 TatD family hydrolase [Bacteroidales bacterium]
MQLADTHTHLYLPEFDNDRDEMISRALACGVEKMLMPNIDINSVEAMLSAANRYKGICLPMTGLHPTSVGADYPEQLEKILDLHGKHNLVAIGEIGIDLYWDKSHLKEQLEAMRQQVAFAISKNLPVVIHSRESFPEVFSVLDEFRGEKLSGVLHAFSGTTADAERAGDMGFMLGIGGPVTYKNSKTVEVVKAAGIRNIVLETDSPWLSPVPHRGRRNESSYIAVINRKIAEILGISEEESARVTFENSCRLFNI